jgi:GMP synthase (glutamine-hydrolysing)
LQRHHGDAAPFSVNVADGESLPQGIAIDDLDGVVITGSPLNIYRPEPAVTRQLALARQIFERSVPVYGSCWGLQLMSAALGGNVAKNPKGRELGIARNIGPVEHGQGHPLLEGKAPAFDALCSHEDEVVALPEGGRRLAANGFSAIQAAEIARDGGSFWGVQYHPEYGFESVAAIIESRAEVLVEEGLARRPEDLRGLIDDMRTLARDPGRRDVAWRLGADAHVLDPALRGREIGNWIRAKAVPRAATR